MTKTVARQGAPQTPDQASTASAELANLNAAHEILAKARSRVEGLGVRHDKLTGEIEMHRTVVQATGDQLAAEPSLAADRAFSDATAHASSLEAQKAALRDRLIPGAKSFAEEAATAAEEARVAYNHALFRAEVRDKLIPADRRWQIALTELAAALEECKAVRRELAASPEFRSFYILELSHGTRRHLLQLSVLGSAVPFELAEYFCTYAAGERSVTRQTVAPELGAMHIETFGLEEEA